MAPDWSTLDAPGEAVIDALARAVIDGLPRQFREPAREVALRVEDFPSAALLDEMGIGNPFGLTGLYSGIPLTQKSVMDQPDRPDTIWLFRRPILNEWAARRDTALGALVANVVIHELAHHLGWSDADIARIDRWWE